MSTAEILAAARANKPAAAAAAPATPAPEVAEPKAESGENGTTTNGNAAEMAAPEPAPAATAASELAAGGEQHRESATASAVQVKAGALPQTVEEKIAYCRRVDSK